MSLCITNKETYSLSFAVTGSLITLHMLLIISKLATNMSIKLGHKAGVTDNTNVFAGYASASLYKGISFKRCIGRSVLQLATDQDISDRS